jgi:DNA-binding IclR family transcriptional regulator
VRASRAAPTAARALRVLELVATEPTKGWKLAELQRELGYSHGNLHAIAATMTAMGYLLRDDRSRTYQLGPSLLALSSSATLAFPSVAVAGPFLDALADELRTEAHAAVVVADEIVLVARRGPHMPLGAGVRVGARMPLTPPLGSTLVAWWDPVALDRYYASASSALTPEEIDRHRRSLEAVRRRGYSVHVYREPNVAIAEAALRAVEDGVDDPEVDFASLAHELIRQDYLPESPDQVQASEGVQVSAPVFGPDGTVELSVGVAFPGGARDRGAVVGAPEALLAVAAEITAAIGGVAPPSSEQP